MINFLALISPRVWAAVALSIALAGALWKAHHAGYVAGQAEIQAAWDQDIAERTAKALAAEQAAHQREKDLQTAADAQRRKANAQITSLGVELGESLQRLRHRPERPSTAAGDVPAAAGARPGGCTGAELYKPDGEFLARLAADADRLRIGLEACQSAYSKARAVSITPSH